MQDLSQYLKATQLLNHEDKDVVHKREHLLTLVTKPKEQLQVLYAYVAGLKNCYSENDDLQASRVLRESCGQCNTKTILLMALARGADIPCRVHAYKIHKHAHSKRVPGWILAFAPKTTVFLWPEFYINRSWQPLQKIVFLKHAEWKGCPFDGAAHQLRPLQIGWIAEDLGVWDSPDELFRKHKPTVHGWRKLGWKLVGRRVLNRRNR